MIVVGVDEDSALSAVAWAAREAVLHDAPLTLVSTSPGPETAGVPRDVPAGFSSGKAEKAERRLDQAVAVAEATARGATAPQHRPDITRVRATGSPVHELLARSESASMVVVGTHRYGPLERMILGSVSAAVVAHARCPVAVVRELPHVEADRISGPVVVGVDGTPSSKPATDVAFEEAALRGVGVVAVHAWSDVDLQSIRASGEFEWNDIRVRETALLSESLAGYAQDYPDVSVEPEVVMDRPARNLRKKAETAQLLVVGSRGRGGFVGMMLGSTSRALVHWVSCPLVVVR